LRAKGIEQTILKDNNGVTAAYKAKIRSLFVNLKDKNNPTLRERVVSGDLPVERFCKMTSQVRFRLTPAICIAVANVFVPQEMASDERKAADSKIMEENLHKSLGAQEQGAETEGFQCHRCKQVMVFSSCS
jgi:transcription elongation factor S-II